MQFDDFNEAQQQYIKEHAATARTETINRAIRYPVVLDKYEMDNLLWLFNAIGYKVFTEQASFRHEAFQPLNTGDWNGQIPWKLKAAVEQIHTELHVPYIWAPNVRDEDEFRARVDRHIDALSHD